MRVNNSPIYTPRQHPTATIPVLFWCNINGVEWFHPHIAGRNHSTPTFRQQSGGQTWKRGRVVAGVEKHGAADVADAAERGRGHEDPSDCLRKTRDRAQQKVDSSVLAHVFNA
nr:MAG TPA: hypothetical protein [Caudoviricetes sp.]